MEPVIQTAPGEEPTIAIDLSHEQIGNLAFIVNSPAYLTFYRPFLVGMLRSFYNDLGDPTGQRKWEKPDDYLRGGIAVVKALLNFPEQVLAEEREQAEREAAGRTPEEQYEKRAETGPVGPGYSEDEDF